MDLDAYLKTLQEWDTVVRRRKLPEQDEREERRVESLPKLKWSINNKENRKC